MTIPGAQLMEVTGRDTERDTAEIPRYRRGIKMPASVAGLAGLQAARAASVPGWLTKPGLASC
jgi:hypothetical protein